MMRKKLALFGGDKIRKRPFPSSPVLGREEKKEVGDVLKTGLLSGFVAKAGSSFLGGPKVLRLENDVRNYFGVRYAVAVNSATAGLHCAVAAAGAGPGDEVIVSP
ncbi:MAG: DegT/DnrJ/EryC1/StrS family aminotransferase, partial [Candidatus Omnitrophica bacterium]|nr:DegT/DnrJ/EryC1/StrS family aminotransferase [Candidatus Omnitrophota bacterium]